jgi:hypothetical protein
MRLAGVLPIEPAANRPERARRHMEIVLKP